jgi:hypothetical protein
MQGLDPDAIYEVFYYGNRGSCLATHRVHAGMPLKDQLYRLGIPLEDIINGTYEHDHTTAKVVGQSIIVRMRRTLIPNTCLWDYSLMPAY